MGKTKIVLNRAGVRELMQSPEMQEILVDHANKIASASETEAYVAQTRAVVKVCGAQIPQIISGIRSAFSNVDWGTIGHNIIQGIANGLRNAGHMLWEAVKGLLGSFKDNVLSFFGIHSPSRWGIYVGEMIDTGFAKGIIGELPSITSAVSKLQDIATSPFTNTNLNYDLQGTANSSRTSGNETASRLDTLIALLRAIIAIIDGKPSGDVSERELIRALRDMGVVFE